MTASVIDIFSDPRYECLSNFASGFGFWIQGENSAASPWEREWWPSAEHYFQAGKFDNPILQERIRTAADAAEAKGLGRRLAPLRLDWESAKRAWIHRAMLEKIWAHTEPRQALLDTGTAAIVNGNPVDRYFGTGQDGQGANIIGTEFEQLREFVRTFPERRQVMVKIGSVGEPFEPFSVYVDLTGLSPAQVPVAVAAVLRQPSEALESLLLVTEGGFEKTSVDSFSDAAVLEAFLMENKKDCIVEVHFQDLAVVTLWDGPNDNHLATADVRYFCNCAALLRSRLSLLVPSLEYEAFKGTINCIIDDEHDAAFAVYDATFPRVLAAAADGRDVLISAMYVERPELQRPLRTIPTDLGPCKVACGDHTALDKVQLADRIRGVVWGAALGDSVGLATEFMTKEEAARTYSDIASLGPAVRCQDRHRSRWQLGDWTDDTDQLILVLDAIVAGGGVFDQQIFARSLLDWREHGFPELGDTSGMGIGQTVNGVLEHPAYSAAPDVAAEIIWRQGGKSMAANGAVMRCAASGLAYFWDDETVAYNAAAGAAVTHADPRCIASCVAVCSVIARALLGVDLSTTDRRRDEALLAYSAAARCLGGGNLDELCHHVDIPVDGLEGLRLGTGGIGYTLKSLGAGCWAFLHAESFREAIQKIVMEAGDADSNAVVAGAMLGARFGYAALPKSWIEDVPVRQRRWMDEKVAKLLHLLGLAA